MAKQSHTFTKWNLVSLSCQFFEIPFGIRPGFVLSKTLFTVYINDVVSQLLFSFMRLNMQLLYADDVLLMAPSVGTLQRLLAEHQRLESRSTTGAEAVNYVGEAAVSPSRCRVPLRPYISSTV